MHRSVSPAVLPALTTIDPRHRTAQPASIVDDESTWRTVHQRCTVPGPRVIPTRWHAIESRAQEVEAETPDDCHVVKIVLRNMNIRFSVAGRTVQDGIATPGMFHVTEPAARVRCLFRGAYDTLHLHVPNDLIAECAYDMPGRQAAVLCSEAQPTKDSTIEWLGRALLKADEVAGSAGRLYADCIGVGIVARLLTVADRRGCAERPRVTELARWRLKRAIDFVEAHLAEPVSLAGVASAAGLTRMHFAAQFKAATGLRPHEYLLRRRIERAQEMLVGTSLSVVDVALSVGFQTQSHFTTVFNRFAGQPPRAWRERARASAADQEMGHEG